MHLSKINRIYILVDFLAIIFVYLIASIFFRKKILFFM